MNLMDVAILMVRTAARVVQISGVRTAEQILVETMHTHPDLPWSLVIDAMLADDPRLWWAARALKSYHLSDGGGQETETEGE